MSAPWSQTGLGRAVDLLSPSPLDIDLETDVAEALARIARFTGHVRSGPYSVAQHSVLGADAMFRETGRSDLAAAFLLHDAHEFLLGDIATPVAQAIAIAVADELRAPVPLDEIRRQVNRGMDNLKSRMDAAIFAAAGLPWPLPAEDHAAIKAMDLRMLATERRYLLGPSPRPWGQDVESAPAIRMVGKMTVWPWPLAADHFRERLRRYLPNRQSTTRRKAA